MANYAQLDGQFRAAGARIVALSVDPPQRASDMARDLGVEFTILCDSSRKVIIEWGLLNEREHGGIAIPATFLLDRDRVIRMRHVEDTLSRIEPRAMLEIVRNESAPVPKAKMIFPGAMFLRSIANGFRHGVKVKRN